MPTHSLGRKYDLIDVGRADCHVHDQDHRQGRVRKVSGTSGKYAGQTKKYAGQAEKSAGDSESLQVERSHLLGTQMLELVTLRP